MSTFYTQVLLSRPVADLAPSQPLRLRVNGTAGRINW